MSGKNRPNRARGVGHGCQVSGVLRVRGLWRLNDSFETGPVNWDGA